MEEADKWASIKEFLVDNAYALLLVVYPIVQGVLGFYLVDEKGVESKNCLENDLLLITLRCWLIGNCIVTCLLWVGVLLASIWYGRKLTQLTNKSDER